MKYDITSNDKVRNNNYIKNKSRFFLFVSIILCLSFLFISNVQASSNNNKNENNKCFKINADFLTVRSFAGLKGQEIDKLKSGTLVIVLDDSDEYKDGYNWTRIFYGNNYTSTGWVASEFLIQLDIEDDNSQVNYSYGEQFATVNANALIVRNTYGITSQVKDELKFGTQVNVLLNSKEYQDGYNWVRIFYGDNYTSTGWVMIKYLNI